MATRKALQRKHLGRKQEQQGIVRKLDGFCGELEKAVQRAKEDSAKCEAITVSMAQAVERDDSTEADFACLKQQLPVLLGEQQNLIEKMGPDSPLAQSTQMFLQWNRLILKVVQHEDERAQQRATELDVAKQQVQELESTKKELETRVECLDEKCVEMRETQQRCRICFDEDRPLHVLVPCGHTACSECAPRLRECHTCRAKIKMTCKLHL